MAVAVVSLQITEQCNLNCTYCYQINKTNKKMTFETGKKIIDFLFSLYEEDNPEYSINKTTEGLNLTFIGGETLLNAKLMLQIADYVNEQCRIKDHVWKNHIEFTFNTNGLLYFSKDFQDFITKYYDVTTIIFSIDGPKEMHDACRKDYNGKGSFDQTYAALEAYRRQFNRQPNINMVIYPDNLKYLAEVYDFVSEISPKYCGIGPVNDYKWTKEEASLYYYGLKSIADKMLINPEPSLLDKFKLTGYKPIELNQTDKCGGINARGLAFGIDGRFYNCLRFSSCSLPQGRAEIQIGDTSGFNITDEIREIYKLNKSDFLPDECLKCPISLGCDHCPAIGYHQTGKFVPYVSNSCWMWRASALVTSYFFNMMARLLHEQGRTPVFLNKETALQIIPEQEYNTLLLLAQEGDIQWQ